MKILVNATAARSSGALTILRQFLSHLGKEDRVNQYFLFYDPSIEIENENNVIRVPVDTRSWRRRILWDCRGIEKWCQKNDIKSDLVISLQNTGVVCRVPQLIYYHQLLPLVRKRWNFFSSRERSLFVYTHFYSFFVRLFLRNNSYFVVQIPSIRDAFCKKFRVKTSNVFVLRPDIKVLDYSSVPLINFGDDCVHFVYPATPLVYKNHRCLVKVLDVLRKSNPQIIGRIRIHFTFSKDMDMALWKSIHRMGLEKCFVFDGSIPFNRLLSYYKSCRALLFPSYIESFGLPLVEAAGAGLPVLVTDLPYARDVIGKYAGAHFIGHNDIEAWAEAIETVSETSIRYEPLSVEGDSDWSSFFRLVNKIE